MIPKSFHFWWGSAFRSVYLRATPEVDDCVVIAVVSCKLGTLDVHHVQHPDQLSSVLGSEATYSVVIFSLTVPCVIRRRPLVKISF